MRILGTDVYKSDCTVEIDVDIDVNVDAVTDVLAGESVGDENAVCYFISSECASAYLIFELASLLWVALFFSSSFVLPKLIDCAVSVYCVLLMFVSRITCYGRVLVSLFRFCVLAKLALCLSPENGLRATFTSSWLSDMLLGLVC